MVYKIAKKFIQELEQSSETNNRNSYVNVNLFKEIMTEFQIKNNDYNNI